MQRRHFLQMAATGGFTAASGAVPAQARPRFFPGAITDVAGIKVGHFTDTRRPTGCTVVLTEEGAVAGVDVRGSAPGTRETDLLAPANLVEKVHAILLSGGSAFGLEAATGVVRYLEERKIGHDVGAAGVVPIVPAAILFDLNVGDPTIRPNAAAGYQACTAATGQPPAQGSVGAGTGATVGKLWGMGRAMKGGIGTASVSAGGFTMGAVVAVNAVGDVQDPATGRLIAGARSADGRSLQGAVQGILAGQVPQALLPGTATTIGVVASDARLTKAQCQKLAQIAHDGLARTINPAHTMWDGDTLFALATGRVAAPASMMLLGVLAAEAMARAVVNAVLGAKGLPDLPAAGEMPV